MRDSLYNIRNDIPIFADETQNMVEGLSFRFQVVIDWYADIVMIVNLPPFKFMEGMRLEVCTSS